MLTVVDATPAGCAGEAASDDVAGGQHKIQAMATANNAAVNEGILAAAAWTGNLFVAVLIMVEPRVDCPNY